MNKNILFVNRQEELNSLEQEYKRQGASFTVIYGRRRVGKTALISQFIKDKPAVYYYAIEAGAQQQLSHLTREILRFLNKPYLNELSFPDIEQLIIFFAEQMPGDKKVILAIDEYQQLAKNISGCSSLFQRAWDLQLCFKNIHLILCGSVISMMHSEVLDYSAPLYGRRTSNIRLQAMKFAQIKDFIPGLSPEDRMRVFASFGTIPKYLELYDHHMSFWDNIKNNILHKDAYLYQEIRFLLKEEIGEITTYFSILQTMARGEAKLGNIAKRLEVSSSHLSRYMQKLMDLDLIFKEVPITEKNPAKSRLGRYFFKDKFLAFWFHYVFKNSSLLEIGQTEPVMEEIKSTFNEKFVAYAFEDYAREEILNDPLTLLGFVPEKIGRWWKNKQEIDLIAIGQRQIAFIECKWRNQLVGYEVYRDLLNKSQLINTSLEPIYVIFSKNGFKPGLQNIEGLKCITF